MGKGIIKSGGDDGLYGIELTLHRDRVDATIEIINAQIEALTAKINGMEEGDAKDLEKLRRASYQKRKDYLQLHMPEDPTISAWCGDLTEDLSGNVGTIEVPGERGIVLIQPGHDGNAVYDSTRDGQLQPSIAGTPAGTFYNLAMLPGWQKWMPTYRFGTISNIDTDANTCDVAMEAAISSQQSLDVNQADTLTGISIEYMSCNASAFEGGDSVLVEFEGQDWSGAKVVGFKDNPKACGFQFKLTRGDGTLVDSAEYEWATIFSCRNASGQNFAPENVIYDDEPSSSTYQYWYFDIPEFAKDEDGYWIKFNWIEDSIPTVYPYKYKTADQYQEVDLIKPGKYEAAVPYWKISYENNKPIYVDWATWGSLSCDEKFAGLAEYPHFYWDASGADFYHYTAQSDFYKKVIVKSSISYKITEQLNCSSGQYISCFGYNATGTYGECPEPASLCLSYSASTRFYGEVLDITYETGDTCVSASEEHIHSSNIGGQTHTINAEITAGSGAYHAECWEWPEGNFYEKDVTATWYRNSSNKREISQFINIYANYDY